MSHPKHHCWLYIQSNKKWIFNESMNELDKWWKIGQKFRVSILESSETFQLIFDQSTNFDQFFVIYQATDFWDIILCESWHWIGCFCLWWQQYNYLPWFKGTIIKSWNKFILCTSPYIQWTVLNINIRSMWKH